MEATEKPDVQQRNTLFDVIKEGANSQSPIKRRVTRRS